MIQRIFIDVGAYPSWTIDIALLPEFKIDYVYAFDPSPKHHTLLNNLYGKDKRITIVKAGLWSKTCTMPLYNEGSVGGSVFKDFKTSKPNGTRINCEFIQASEWFTNNIRSNAFVVLKLNCEASECEILDDLITTREYTKITHTLVDFDVDRTNSQKHRRKEILDKINKLKLKKPLIWSGGRNRKRRVLCDKLTLFKDPS